MSDEPWSPLLQRMVLWGSTMRRGDLCDGFDSSQAMKRREVYASSSRTDDSKGFPNEGQRFD